jgi:AraC-like DNA-binding protein
MKYEEFPVISELKEYIQLIFIMESEDATDLFREQIMPDGIVELVFHFGDPMYTYQDNHKFKQPQSFAISMMRKYIEIESSGRTGVVSVRFYPWGAHHFFSKPVNEFLDQTISTDKLWKDEYAKIIQELKSADNENQRINNIQLFLLDRLNEYKKKEVGVDQAIKLIRESKGQLSIDEVCDRTGFSKKMLERKFPASVGTTPKIFSRITRFLDICSHLKENSGKSLTELSYECGFYDQSHFIKEFKEFSGFTPKEFFAKNNVVFSEI